MDFGRVPDNELNDINFKLAPDPAFNKKILTGKQIKDPRIYVGCAKWGRTEWIGKIYPEGTREKNFLDHYVKHYNSIELNATHYKIYGATGIAKWAEKARGMDFKFCPKIYQGISHRGRLDGKSFILNEYFRGIVAFEEHLGPIFLQLSDTFGPKRKQELFDFIGLLPTNLQFFLELRHHQWYADEALLNEVLQKLQALNMGFVITDTSGRRECAHMNLTIPKTFIRFVGNSLHPTDYTRIDDWVERIQYWVDKGLQELYFFMHMHDETLSPELSKYLIEKINNACGTHLKPPVFLEADNKSSKKKPPSLFD